MFHRISPSADMPPDQPGHRFAVLDRQHMPHLAGQDQGLPSGWKMILPPPDHRRRGRQPARGGGQVKPLHPIRKQHPRPINLTGPQARIVPRQHGGAGEIMADPIWPHRQPFQPGGQTLDLRGPCNPIKAAPSTWASKPCMTDHSQSSKSRITLARQPPRQKRRYLRPSG